jgi:hypothetical protein
VYCPNCGTQNEDNAAYCKNCGAALQTISTPNVDVPPPPQYQAQAQGQTQGQAPVPNYLVPAILTTIFCCLPFGIVSIVYAAQVNGKVEAGDRAGAQESSRKAKMWAWISFCAGLVVIVGYVILVVLGVVMEGASGA